MNGIIIFMGGFFILLIIAILIIIFVQLNCISNSIDKIIKNKKK
jgi:hypothetical protein